MGLTANKVPKPNLSLEPLRKRGCEVMLTYYGKITPHLNEPLYTRTPEPSGYSGVSLSLPVFTGGAGYLISKRNYFFP